jgi:TonB family protein
VTFVSRALLDVLFASLWQDAIIGLCAAALLVVIGKRLNAATRHVVLQAALVAMVVVPALTTLPHISSSAITLSGYGTASSAAATGAGNAQHASGLRSIDVALADRVALAIAAVWVAGALAFFLRIALGAAQLSRFVRQSERLENRNGVRVYASPRIPVPVAFGLLRPAIVVPTEIVAQGGTELECVLLHELAHVHRRDAWLHTFERIVHALLYFNPAVILLLASLELEREAACDDWAVAHSRDTEAYTHSLAVLAVRTSFNVEMPAACGAIGFGHGIVNRIERLEDQRRNGSLLLSPFALGGFAFMLIGLALSLQLLAPAIAFSPQATVVQPAVASSSCTRGAMITYPARPQGQLPAGSVTVKVSVSPTGNVTAATVATSSGIAILDRAAVKAAKESGYEPAMRNCKPVAGMYLFKLSTAGAEL